MFSSRDCLFRERFVTTGHSIYLFILVRQQPHCLLNTYPKNQPTLIEIVCHRGANEIAPENTLSAADRSLAWGVDYLEVDVRPSRDGILYVLHDADVDRTTDGTGLLSTLASEEVDALDAGSWFSNTFAGEPVPRVETYLNHIRGRARVFFDVKDADHSSLLDLIDRTGFRSDCFFWSGDPTWSLELSRQAPDLPIKINVNTPEDVEQAKREFNALIERARAHDIKVMVYHQQKDEDAFRRILDLDIEMVNLNHADAFLRVAKERSASN